MTLLRCVCQLVGFTKFCGMLVSCSCVLRLVDVCSWWLDLLLCWFKCLPILGVCKCLWVDCLVVWFVFLLPYCLFGVTVLICCVRVFVGVDLSGWFVLVGCLLYLICVSIADCGCWFAIFGVLFLIMCFVFNICFPWLFCVLVDSGLGLTWFDDFVWMLARI